MSKIDNYLNHARQALSTGQPEMAKSHVQKALDLEPNNGDAHAVMGGANMRLGHQHLAHKNFQQAASRCPHNRNYQLNYAISSQAIGKNDDAITILERLIDNDDSFAPAYYVLSNARKFSVDDQAWIQKFESLKRGLKNTNTDYELICFALGKIYDDIGDFNRAFTTYSEGNNCTSRMYDHNQEVAYLKSVREEYLKYRSKDVGHENDTPVFIVGMPRTGSTLVENRLASSPLIVGLGERNDIYNLKKSVTIDNFSPEETGKKYIEHIKTLAPNAERTVDKNLFNHELVGFIKTILPGAHIVDIRRDPADTCLACYFQRFGAGMDFTYSLDALAAKYALYHEIMKFWANEFQIFRIDYEHVIRSPEISLRALFEFLRIDPPSTIGAANDHTITTASVWQARQPIYSSSVKRWKNYEQFLQPLFTAFERYGFDYEGVG